MPEPGHFCRSSRPHRCVPRWHSRYPIGLRKSCIAASFGRRSIGPICIKHVYRRVRHWSASRWRTRVFGSAGACLLWVMSRHWVFAEPCPLYPRRRTSPGDHRMSVLCHDRKSAASLDHLVGANQKRFWDCEPECVRGLEVDYQLELSRLLDRQIGGLGAA